MNEVGLWFPIAMEWQVRLQLLCLPSRWTMRCTDRVHGVIIASVDVVFAECACSYWQGLAKWCGCRLWIVWLWLGWAIRQIEFSYPEEMRRWTVHENQTKWRTDSDGPGEIGELSNSFYRCPPEARVTADSIVFMNNSISQLTGEGLKLWVASKWSRD